MTPQTTYTADPQIVEKVRKIGRKLTYNKKASINDCLTALVGDWTRLKQLEDMITVRLTKDGALLVEKLDAKILPIATNKEGYE